MSCPHCKPSSGEGNGPCVAFNSIGKDRADFFDNGYFHSKNVSVRLKNLSGVELLHDCEMMPRGNVYGSFAVAYKNPKYTVSLDKFGVKTDGRISLDAAMRLTNSLKLLVAAEDSRQEPGKPLHSFGRLGIEYRNPMVAFASDVDIVNGPVLRSSLVGSYNSLRVGVTGVVNAHLDDKFVRNNLMSKSASLGGGGAGGVTNSSASASAAGGGYKAATPEVVDVSVAMQYRGVGWLAAMKTRDYCKFMRVSYIQTLSPDLEVGAQVDYGIRVNTQKLHVGARMNIDEKSTFKAKLDSNATLSASFTQQLSAFMRMTVCAEVDVTDWSAESHKFGFGLTFEQP